MTAPTTAPGMAVETVRPALYPVPVTVTVVVDPGAKGLLTVLTVG